MNRGIWISIVGVFCAFGIQAGLLNEWNFEADPAGRMLSQSINSGSSVPPAQFSAGYSNTVFTTNRTLICTGEDTGTGGVWTNGAVLDAALTSITTGVRYLRYDLKYSLTNSLNNSGTVLGAYFTDSIGNRVAGLVLGYDKGNLGSTKPASLPITAITNGLARSGTLTAIAAMDLGSGTLKVWYSLNGSTAFNSNAPAASTNITLSAINNLRFHATGDFRPAGSDDYATIDNIRMADSWTDITAPVPDFSTGPAVQIVSVTVTNQSGTAGTEIGETNSVTVVIRNLNAPATNLISSVSAGANAGYFTITSNNTPVVLTYPQYVTNTFSLTANTNAQNGTYTFNVAVTAAGGVNTNTTFSMTVGSLISYLTNSITWVSGGIIHGKYEPGEIIDITVISTNNGALTVTNILNSLSADPSYFTVSNLTSALYPSMSAGDATSTTYRVTINTNTPNGTRLLFGVTNQSGSRVWAESFEVLPPVFSQGSPAVSPGSITMSVLAGTVITNTQVVVTNSGNAAYTFNITDAGTWGSFYAVSTGTRGISDFAAANNVIALKYPGTNSIYISSTNAGVSSMTNIGFGFPFYGTIYSNFYVTADGYIGLSNATNVPLQSVDRKVFPAENGVPLIAPFWGNLTSPDGSVRMIRQQDYLVISYIGVSKEAGSTDLEFQAALFTNGCIEFRYKRITGVTNTYGLTNVTIGIQGSAGSCTNLTVTPVNGTSVRLTPQPDQWVRYPTQSIRVEPQSSQAVSFIADASGKTAGTATSFSARFNWSTGGSNAVSVSVSVTAAAPVYSAVSSISFTGAAGQVASVPFVITNTGTGPLNFNISNSVSAAAGFIATNSAYSWNDISATGTKVVLTSPSSNPYITAADEGFSAMIPIGFVFPFYGGSYTQVCVSVNGTLRLDTTGRVFAAWDLSSTNGFMPAQLIAPYWGELLLDENAAIKYRSTAEQLVITWENVRQYGLGGGSNQTFQAVLNPDGGITFQYKKLEGAHWPNTTIGLRDTATRTKQADLRQSGDWSVSTSSVSGSVYTQYVNAISNRAVQFLSAQIQVIRYTPDGGSIAAGSNAVITVTGDASNQSPGSGAISTNTTLTITHNAAGIPVALAVNFTVTNSLEAVFDRAASDFDDSDGDGFADDAERIAGTDPQNAGSVFTPKIENSASGASLSWDAPLDGSQRTYTVYFTTDLKIGWNYLAAVTNGTAYLDTAHGGVPAIYYKVTAQ